MALAAHAASAGGSEPVWPSGRVKATRKKYAKPTANPTPTLAAKLVTRVPAAVSGTASSIMIRLAAGVEPHLAPREDAGRATPLDLEVLDLVPAMRAVRHHGLVPREGGDADQGGEAEERRHDLPHADAAGAQRDELVLARQKP